MQEKDLEIEVDRQLAILSDGVNEIVPWDEFRMLLTNSIRDKRPLRVKCGIDPTNVDIHLGHLVPYRKMRQFQDLGHQGVVIIGDYTAQIGDPTGKNESRPALSSEQAKINAKTYMKQIYVILDKSKTEVHYQTEWFSDKTLIDVMKWAGQTTVAKLLSHETFKNRLDQGLSLGLHELFYPVLQGVDSVYVEADVELGGSDQKFNVLMGRDYQRHREMRPQVALLMPLIIGLDGKEKMSKSLNNYIGVMDDAFDKFGKVMSIPDDLMLHYYQYIVFTPSAKLKEWDELFKAGKTDPNEAKKELAVEIVAIFHGIDTAREMRVQFEAVFKKGKVPDDVDEYQFSEGENILRALVNCGLLPSNGEVKRLIKQNAISVVGGERIKDINFVLDDSIRGKVVKVGKRKFVRML